VQGRWFGQRPLALLEQVGDVLGTEDLEVQGIVQGALDRLDAVEFAQGEDLPGVVARVEMADFQLLIVVGGVGTQVQETGQELLLAGAAALEQERLRVIGMFVVLMPVVAAEVFGDQLALVIDQEPSGPTWTRRRCRA